ncbi:MAG: MFS transporter [Bifidobacteriaceae bacterium]|jgi:MFS family permease|nr:MFS transporter [Bifidobacteriaceae bacterium]
MSSNTIEPTKWLAQETDETQKKPPYKVGLALMCGVFLYLGPYMGTNVILLPAKTAQLAPDSKAAVIALLSTSAMVVATIANIVFGTLSDMTRSRIGRRSPWIIGGSILTAISLLLLNTAPNVTVLVLYWCVFQLGLNAIIAPFVAIMADRVAPKYRGTISSMYAFGYSVGIYTGQMVGAQFLDRLNIGFWVLAAAVLFAGPLAAIIMREPSSLDMPKLKFDRKVIITHFSIPLHNARDYYLALFGKFLIMAAKFSITGFQLYILTDYMKLDTKGSTYYVSIISMCMMVTAIGMTILTGIISDRIKSRKLPVILSAIFIAAGSILPFFSPNPNFMIAYAILAGMGLGAFNAVDQALNVEVLPNADSAAKDLGILNLANTGGQILGPVIAAALISSVGYHALFPLAAAFAIVGLVLIALIRKVK